MQITAIELGAIVFGAISYWSGAKDDSFGSLSYCLLRRKRNKVQREALHMMANNIIDTAIWAAYGAFIGYLAGLL